MLGAVFRGNGRFAVEEVPVPDLKSHEVLVKVDSATICATDIHIIDGNQPSNPPVILGHEYSGIVVKMGCDVTNVTIGDRVTVEPHVYCGRCKYCRTGKMHLCLDKKAFGVHLNGGLAELSVVPDTTLYRLPEAVSLEQAALCENIGCCLHGIDRLRIQAGDSVVILGGGFVGMILAQLCRLHGCGILIVSEPKEQRRAMLLKNGADAVIDPLNEDLANAVMARTNGLGADIVIEAAGRQETAQLAHSLAARGGKVMYYGVVPPGQEVRLEPNEIFRKELTILGSAINPDTHHRVLEILPHLNLDGCVTHRYALRDIEKGLQAARSGEGIKICIKPNEIETEKGIVK